MATLLVRETYVNQTENYRFGDSNWYEAWTESRQKLFSKCQKEFGRCVSKMYRDFSEGAKAVGWVFEKKMQYEDHGNNRPPKFYIREVWVEVKEVEPEETD